MPDGNLNPAQVNEKHQESLWFPLGRLLLFVSALLPLARRTPVLRKTPISEWRPTSASLQSLPLPPTLSSPTRHPDALFTPQIPAPSSHELPVTLLWDCSLRLSPPQTVDIWWQDSLLPLWGAPLLLNEWRLAGWEPEWNIGKEQLSVCIYSLVDFFTYGMTSNSSRKQGVDLYSTREKTSWHLQHLSRDINHKLTKCLLHAIWTAHQLRLSEKQMRLWRKGAKVSKICSFIRVKLDKHTYIFLI